MRFLFITLVCCFCLPSFGHSVVPEPSSVVDILARFSRNLKGDRSAYLLAMALIDSDLRGELVRASDPWQPTLNVTYFKVTYMPPYLIRSERWGFLRDSRMYVLVREQFLRDKNSVWLRLQMDLSSQLQARSHLPPYINLAPTSDSGVLALEQAHYLNRMHQIGPRVRHALEPVVPNAQMRRDLASFVVELSAYAAAIREVEGFRYQPFLVRDNQIIKKPFWNRGARLRAAREIRTEFAHEFARPAEITLKHLRAHLSAMDIGRVLVVITQFINVEDFYALGLPRATEDLHALIQCVAPLVPPHKYKLDLR